MKLSPFRVFFDVPQASMDASRSPYAVTADGERFLFNAVTTDVFERGITVVMHWPAAVKR